MEIPVHILWAVAGVIGMKALDWVVSLAREQTKIKEQTILDLKASIDSLRSTVETNSKSTNELRFAVGALEKSIAPLPKLEKDLNEAHAKIREIKVRIDKGAE